MKRFIFKSGFFLLAGIMVFAPITLLNRTVISRIMEVRRFSLGTDIKTMIMGDSHPAASLDPALLPGSVNVSKALENFFCSYYKLKMLLDANPGIRNVILGFSYHNVSRYHENYLFRDREASTVLSRYFVLLDDDGIKKISCPTQEFVVNYLKFKIGVPIEIFNNIDLLKNFFGSPQLSNYPFWGTYYASGNTNLDSELIDKKIRRYFYGADGRYIGTSGLMVEYLEKIAGLCETRGVDLFLFNSPLHPEFRKYVPNEVRRDFEDIKEKILKAHPRVCYIDLSEYPLQDSQYGDGDHTNCHGAEIVTRLVSEAQERAIMPAGVSAHSSY